MKRKLLALIFMLPFFVSSPALATEKDQSYWDYKEMENLSAEFREEVLLKCGKTDYDCQRMEIWQRSQLEEKYEALSIFEPMPFIITAVNPSKKSIRLIYYDIEDILQREGIIGDFSLRDLYIIRFSKGYYNGLYKEAIESGKDDPGIHIVLNERSKNNGPDWFTENEELEFLIEDFELNQDVENVFWYHISTPQVGYAGIYNFSSCINSDDYRDGMECRIMFSKENSFYLPFEVQEEENVDLVDDFEPDTDSKTESFTMASEPINNREPQEKSTILNINYETNQKSSNSQENGDSSREENDIMSDAKKEVMTLPLGGHANKDTLDERIFVVSIICLAIILWWILFFRKKKRQKKC